ncbi:MAG: hypothetical protein WA220_09890 [Candidatus Nitrosopolaris sp.]
MGVVLMDRHGVKYLKNTYFGKDYGVRVVDIDLEENHEAQTTRIGFEQGLVN